MFRKGLLCQKGLLSYLKQHQQLQQQLSMTVMYNIRAVAQSSASKVSLKSQKDNKITKAEDSPIIPKSTIDSEQNEHLFSDDGLDRIRAKILRADTHAKLFEIYRMFKAEMSIIDYATCLHCAMRLQGNKDIHLLIDKQGTEIKEIVRYLSERIAQMDGFTASNFISNIVKLQLHTPELLNQIADLAALNKWTFTITQTSFFLWALSNSGIQGNKTERYLKYATEHILQVRGEIAPRDLSNIFLAMGKMKQFDENLLNCIEGHILQTSNKFPLNCINMVFNCYEKYYRKNPEVMDALAKQYIATKDPITFRNLSNILISCSNLGYTNESLLEFIEQQILKKIEDNSTNNDTNSSKPNVGNGFTAKKNNLQKLDELDTTNSTLILKAYCKMKIVKTELFQVLENIFTSNLDKASSKDIITYSYAHSMLCQHMINQIGQQNKTKHTMQLFNIKKYNNYFYEVVLPFIHQKIDSYSSRQLQVLFVSASKPLVKKRNICKQLLAIGIVSLPKLVKESEAQSESKEIYLLNHFKLLSNFAITESLLTELTVAFMKNKIPIQELAERYNFVPRTTEADDFQGEQPKVNNADEEN